MAITTVDKRFKGGRKSTSKMKDGDEVFGDVSEMDYSQRAEYIEKKYLPKIKGAGFYFMINSTGFDYDMNGDKKEVRESLMNYYKDNADYTEESLDENTMYKVKDWSLVRKEIDPDTDEVIDEYELTEEGADNTYNSSYLGAMDLNWRVYHDEDYDKWFYVIHPHLGGDPRGNYADAIILEGDDKEELFYRFYEGFISGSASINLEFNDGSNLQFYSEQDSDVYYFRNDVDEDSMKSGSVAQMYLNDFNKYDGWHGDEFLQETVDLFSREKKTDKKALGGGVGDDEPRVYVQILGYPEGKWLEITDYESGEDLLSYIQKWMNDLNKEKGGNREEYAFHDYEGFGLNIYNEYMGESEFDEIIESYSDFSSSDFTANVVEQYMRDTGIDNISTAIEEMNGKYYGAYDSVEDLAIQMVDEGIFIPTMDNMYVSDTDKRIISGEEADARLDNMDVHEVLDLVDKTDEYEQEKYQIEDAIQECHDKISSLEVYSKDVSGYEYEVTMNEITENEEKIEEKERELGNLDEKYFDMYRDDAHEIIYDEIYSQLENDLESFLEEYGYSTKDVSNIPFIQVDYERIADDLEHDYLIIESDYKYYIFNNYKGGGKLIVSTREKKYDFYIVNLSTKKIVKGFNKIADARAKKSELMKKYPKLKIEVVKYAMLSSKFDIKDCTSLSNWEKEVDYNVLFNSKASISPKKNKMADGGSISRFKEGDYVTNSKGKSKGFGVITKIIDKVAWVDFEEKGNVEMISLHDLKKINKLYADGGEMQQQEVTDADFQMQEQQQPSRTKQVAQNLGNMAYEQGQQDMASLKEYLEKDTWKGRIKRGAKKVGQGASWVRQKWIDADFGDGKGKAKFFADGGSLEDKELQKKAIEFIIGSAIDSSSMKDEGSEISFKYKHNSAKSSLSKKLIENTIRFNRKSLEGRKSYMHGGSPYKHGVTTKMANGGDANTNDFCIDTTIQFLNSLSPLKYYLTDKSMNQLVALFTDNITIEMIEDISMFIDAEEVTDKRVGGCNDIFTGDIAYEPSRPNVIKIGLKSTARYSTFEMKDGGELWIQDAVSQMKSKGTIGAFTKQAKSHGMTTVEFAKEVINNPDKYRTRTLRRAVFMKNTNPDKF